MVGEAPAASLSAGLRARDGVEDACSWHQRYPRALGWAACPSSPLLGQQKYRLRPVDIRPQEVFTLDPTHL